MGITVSAASQPSVTGISASGRFAVGEVQEAGSGGVAEWQQDVTSLGATIAGAIVGFFGAGLPGAVVGAYFGPYHLDLALDLLFGVTEQNLIQDEINERNLRDLGEDLRGSAGTDSLGSPTPYYGTDANKMTRNSGGEQLWYPTNPPNLKPWVVKFVLNQSMTLRERNMLGMHMLTIRNDRVTEFIQGIARARLIRNSGWVAANPLNDLQKVQAYNTACTQIGTFARAERDRARLEVTKAREFNSAKKQPILYSRTNVYYSLGGKQVSERVVARYAMGRFVQQQVLGVPHKKAVGRWARAVLTTSASVNTWCSKIAKRNATRTTFAKNQIAAAKAQT